MKYWILSCGFCLFTLLCFSQTSEEIIHQHIDSIGGRGPWQNLKSLRIESTLQMDGDEILLTKNVVRPNLLRQDLHFTGRNASYADKKYFVILNAKQGWRQLPDTYEKVISFSGNELETYWEELSYEDPFLQIIDKDGEVLMLPNEYILGTEYYKFQLNYKSGRSEYCYLHPSTLQIYKRVFLKEGNAITVEYDRYEKQSNGMVLPREYRSETGITTVNRIQINPVIDKQLFDHMKIYNYH